MIYCFDLDGTLCTNTNGDYEKALPFLDRISKVNLLYDAGHTIIIDTARGSTTGVDWTELTKNQLDRWLVKYHKLYLGRKVNADVYVDDKSLSDNDFFPKEKSMEDWTRDNCYKTIWIDHGINENSVVVELGGYKGRWVEEIFKKYNPYIYVLEPIKNFYNELCDKFEKIKIYNVGISTMNMGPYIYDLNLIKILCNKFEKIKIYNVGISTMNKKDELIVSGDSTSKYINRGNNRVEISDFWSIERLLKITGSVDLVQINIEGEEYDLLEYLFETGLIYNFKRLQIEFHSCVKDYVNKRLKIQEKFLISGYEKVWDYPFVFECWQLKNK